MKSISVKRIIALLMVLCMLFGFVGCKKKAAEEVSDDVEYEYEYVYEDDSDVVDGENDATGTGAGTGTGSSKSSKKKSSKGSSAAAQQAADTASGADYQVDQKATITLGISTNEAPEMRYILPTFNKKYPNITVKPVEIASSLYAITSKWTSLAAAGNLPDVVIGSENFGYIMQQGWAYPLDNLVNSDEHKQNILQMGLDRYRYEGKLYALPFRIQFNLFMVNNDLLSTLNLPTPGYDWKISQFMDLLNKCTTDKYSGINYIYNSGEPTYGVDNKLLSAYLPSGYEQYGFNMATKQFDLTANNAFVESNKRIQEMKAVKGLISDDLKATSIGGVSDYEARFGKGADAFVSGKVLIGNHNSWQYDWFLDTLQYNADMYPIPTADNVPMRIQTHVDFVFMNSNCNEKNYKAAYALCRFLSFDEDGCIARTDYFVNHSKQDNGAYTFYCPTSQSQKVLDDYCSKNIICGGIKYSLKKVVNEPAATLVADCNKVIPDFWNNVDQYRKSVKEKMDGGADPAGLVNELQSKINAATKTSIENLSKKVKSNQDKFYAKHSYEAR